MRRKLMPFAVGILVAAVVAACGGGPTPSSNNGLLTEQNAIERAVEHLKRPAPEITGVENPRNPVAWRMTLGEYHQRTGISPSSEGADTPVWVVHMEGESSSAGIVPPESRKTYRYAVAVLDARTGNVIATRHSNEPLAWPTAIDAASMSDPGRMVRETPEPTPTAVPTATPTPGVVATPTPTPSYQMYIQGCGPFRRDGLALVCWGASEDVTLSDAAGTVILGPARGVGGPIVTNDRLHILYDYSSKFGGVALWQAVSPYNGAKHLPDALLETLATTEKAIPGAPVEIRPYQEPSSPTATPTTVPLPTATPEASQQGRVVVAVKEYSVVEQVKIQRFPGSTVTPTAGYLFLIVKVGLRNNTAEEIQATIDVSATHDGIALVGLREGRFYDVPTLDATGRGNTRRLSPDGELPNEIVAFEIPQNTDPKDVTLHFQIVWSVTQTTNITLN